MAGLDVARFLAFVGMVLVNFRLAAEISPASGLASLTIDSIEGRAAALFVILAGIGFKLGKVDTATTLKRVAFLFVIGLLNMLIFPADILHYYALYFLVGLLFLNQSFKMLLFAAFAFIIGWLALVVNLNYDAGWDWNTLTYVDFWQPAGFIRNAFFNGWHPVFPWAAFFIAGMAIANFDLSNRANHRRLAIGGLLFTMLFQAASGMAIAGLPQEAELFGVASIPPGPFYMLVAGCTAISALGFILWLTPLLDQLRLTEWLARPGRQTLTLYIAHIFIGMGLLDAFGLLNGSLTNPQIFLISIAFCAFSIAYAKIWAMVAKRGPLETIMKKVTG